MLLHTACESPCLVPQGRGKASWDTSTPDRLRRHSARLRWYGPARSASTESKDRSRSGLLVFLQGESVDPEFEEENRQRFQRERFEEILDDYDAS